MTNLNKENIKVCTSFISRLKGMSFQRKKTSTIYCFPRCNSIHTFFMFKQIDVFMTDKNNNILYTFKNVKPFRIILPKKGVYYTYEKDC